MTITTSTPAPTISDWQEEVLRRTTATVCWHLDRQEARYLEGDTLFGLLGALDGLSEAASTGDDATIDAALGAAHEALDAAKRDAENAATPGSGRDQCAELDQGDVLTLLRCWAYLDAARRELRDCWISPLQAAERVASIAFGTPHAPEA
jgi:hypothetical protein